MINIYIYISPISICTPIVSRSLEAHKTDQSDRSIGVKYFSIFHPNIPPLVLGMLVGCVATDTSSSN